MGPYPWDPARGTLPVGPDAQEPTRGTAFGNLRFFLTSSIISLYIINLYLLFYFILYLWYFVIIFCIIVIVSRLGKQGGALV